MQEVLQLLNARVESLKERKDAIVGEDYQATINEEVERYRAELTERYQAERNSKLEGIDAEINALHNWIEEESEQVVPETVSEPLEPSEPVQPKVAPVAGIPVAFQRFKTI